MHFDQELDATGLACPLPIVKTKKTITGMAPGQILKVVATDSGSVEDMAIFAEQTGHRLLKSEKEADRFVYFLKRA